jgi:hypothetical protein
MTGGKEAVLQRRARPFAENTAKKQRISPYRVVPKNADRQPEEIA